MSKWAEFRTSVAEACELVLSDPTADMKLLLLLPLSLLADSVDHLRGEEVSDLSKMSIVSPQPKFGCILKNPMLRILNPPLPKVPGSEVEGLPPGSTRMSFKPPQLSDEEVKNSIVPT